MPSPFARWSISRSATTTASWMAQSRTSSWAISSARSRTGPRAFYSAAPVFIPRVSNREAPRPRSRGFEFSARYSPSDPARSLLGDRAFLIQPRPEIRGELLDAMERDHRDLLLLEEPSDELVPRIALRRLDFRHGRELRLRQPGANALGGVREHFRLRRIAAERDGVQEAARAV